MTTILVRPGSGLLRQRVPGLAAHDDGLAHRERLEAFQILRDAPGQRAAMADDAVLRNGDDETDRAHCIRQSMERIGAQAIDPPIGHGACADLIVEIHRGRVPIEHAPVDAVGAFVARVADQLPKQGLCRCRGGEIRGGQTDLQERGGALETCRRCDTRSSRRQARRPTPATSHCTRRFSPMKIARDDLPA